ncbi:MAG: aldo/keto reductase [Lachnospiraceae bacterium]|nr:aldo/keto reductase [Lachnospiraceae bacterium]
MDYFKLNNGNLMPMDGIGVFMLTPAETENAVFSALTEGIRLIDTANAYMNEKAVGRAIKKSCVPREEIFLVTKLWPTVYENEDAIDETLARLNTDYVDLLFLHQPAGNWRQGYKNMEKAYKEGKVKALGISNFPEEWLEELIETAEIPPQMVQVEAHPYFPQTELKKVLAKTGMGLMAWYPLGHGDRNLINEPVFTKLAEKYSKSNAQIILRWHTQAGNIVIPGSRNPVHIRDNFNIFDFTLTAEEMAEIASVDKNVRYYNASIEDVQRYADMSMDFNSQE